MSADLFGQIRTAPRTQIRSASSERVGGQFGHAEGEIAGDASGDDVIEAVDEEQGPLFRSQTVGASAVQVREPVTGGLDNVGD
jgi:hypothetical protein